jgi:hypothetical protein
VGWLVEAQVSEKRAITIFRAEMMLFSLEDEESPLIRNDGFCQTIHTTVQTERTP